MEHKHPSWCATRVFSFNSSSNHNRQNMTFLLGWLWKAIKKISLLGSWAWRDIYPSFYFILQLSIPARGHALTHPNINECPLKKDRSKKKFIFQPSFSRIYVFLSFRGSGSFSKHKPPTKRGSFIPLCLQVMSDVSSFVPANSMGKMIYCKLRANLKIWVKRLGGIMNYGNYGSYLIRGT